MKQGGPKITAPISRNKRTKRSPPIGIICAALSAIVAFLVAFVGTFILAMAMLSSQNNNDPATKKVQNEAQRNKGSLRQPILQNDQKVESLGLINIEERRWNGLIIHTHLGDIRIHFRPELAGGSSIHYIKEIVRSASEKQNEGMGYKHAETMNGRKITEGFMCKKCKFYRAEKQLLLQGIISEGAGPKSKVELGPCPIENYKPKLKCPSHDPNCGCHGPVMTKGMVGWAGGGNGPDFFINTFAKPVDWWENQHTVWGEIIDEKSLKVVESTYELPAHMSGMRMLDQDIEFSLELF